MMKRQGSTNALLQKVTSQLRGERVPVKSKEEDELANYLNSLAQKTTQQSKSVNFEDFGENISISSDSNIPSQKTPPAQKTLAVGAGSKFLKKKVPETDNAPKETPKLAKENVSSPRGPRRSYKPATSIPGTSAQKNVTRTSALGKAAAVTSKISQKNSGSAPAKHSAYVDTDTDDSVSLARYLHPAVRSQAGSPAENSVGKDGNRFLRKTASEKPAEISQITTKTTEVNPASSPGKKFGLKDKVPEYALKSSMKYSTNVQLTSEEESLADFIQRLSSSDKTPDKGQEKKSKKRYRRKVTGTPPLPRTPSPESRPATKRTPSPSPRTPRRTPSSSPRIGRRSRRPHSRSHSQDSDNVESILSEVVDSPETGNSDDFFKGTVQLMDIDSLEPLPLSPEPGKKKKTDTKTKSTNKQRGNKKKSESVFKAKERKDEVRVKAKPKPTSNFLNDFGLHSVDELLDSPIYQDESVGSEGSDILTERSDMFTSKKKQADSASEIVTEIGTGRTAPQRQTSYSEDFDSESITEKIGVSSFQPKSSAASVVKTQYSGEETASGYTEDFTSETESEVDVRSEKSYSDSYTSYDDSRTYSRRHAESRRSKVKHQGSVKMKSIQVQTMDGPGLGYHWNVKASGAVPGLSYGLGFVDPTPIATHVVSADALEAMTSYSPCMLALQDMLKQQLAMTTDFLQVQKRIYDSYTQSLECSYKYTTLEDTKEYIRKNRKPRLTFKKAMKMVTKEMN